MSTKSTAWKEFKSVKDELLSKVNASERAKITKPLMKALLGTAGKELHNDEDKYNHEFEFVRCKEITDEQKDAKYTEWVERIKSGEFAPEKRVVKKASPKKRGETLDDLTLDDDEPDVTASEPSEIDGAGMTKEEKESEDYEVTKFPKAPPTEQEKWEALPVKERAKITIDKQKPKPKEAMPKSKKELLLEAISALEEEENAGITEEQVEEISKRVAVKVFTDLFSEVSQTITSTLSSYVEDTKNQ